MRIRRDAAREHELSAAGLIKRHAELFQHRRDDRLREGRGDVLAAVISAFLFAVMDMIYDGCLKPAEREIEVVADNRRGRKLYPIVSNVV